MLGRRSCRPAESESNSAWAAQRWLPAGRPAGRTRPSAQPPASRCRSAFSFFPLPDSNSHSGQPSHALQPHERTASCCIVLLMAPRRCCAQLLNATPAGREARKGGKGRADIDGRLREQCRKRAARKCFIVRRRVTSVDFCHQVGNLLFFFLSNSSTTNSVCLLVVGAQEKPPGPSLARL